MEKNTVLYTLADKLDCLAILKNLNNDSGFLCFKTLLNNINTAGCADSAEKTAFGNLYVKVINSDSKKLNSLSGYFFKKMTEDENIISAAILKGQSYDKNLDYILQNEIAAVNEGIEAIKNKFERSEIFNDCGFLFKDGGSINYKDLIKFYKTKGCGVFKLSDAFSWDTEKKALCPIENLSVITLNDLKEYKEEKSIIIQNTENFLNGLPANNILLYGDRGTGKSSTIHAILKAYSKKGLRLLEIQKDAVKDFPHIIKAISGVNFKFILFIDDLTFSEDEPGYSQLKAALEGSINKHKNLLIYATSNRRHLIKESHSARKNDDVHYSDTIEEQLSLSDRFGLVITFINPDKKEYLNILRQILIDRKIDCDESFYEILAERYAIKKGGRSPRAAKQFADILESSIKSNTKIDF